MEGSWRGALHVLPDAERVESAMLRATGGEVRLADGRGWCTFAQFVEAVASTAHSPRRPCSPLAARILIASAARAMPVGPFGDFVHEPAFARAVFGLFQELKAGNVSVSDFAAAVRELGPARSARARYLADLYAWYQSELKRKQLIDRGDLLTLATEALAAGAAASYIGSFSEISVSHIYDWTPARLGLWIALARVAETTGTTLIMELPASGSPAIDAAVDGACAELERRGHAWSRFELRKGDYRGGPLAFQARDLFSAPMPPANREVRVDLFSSKTVRDEIYEIARRVRQLIDTGASPEGICVAYRDLGPEAERLEERMSELGVAVQVRRGAPLPATRLGRLALNIAAMVDDGYPVGEFSELLSSRYVAGLNPGPAESEDSARLLALAAVRDNRLGATEDRGAYAVRLGSLVDRLEKKGATALSRECRTLLGRCSQAIKICDRISSEGHWLELLKRWWRSVNALGIVDAVRRQEPRIEEQSSFGREILRATARDQEAVEALDAMTWELEGALRLSGAASQRVSRRLFHRWLLDAAADFNLVPKRPRINAIQVQDLLEIPGRQFGHVFIAGLTDGRFPRRTQDHALFPDEDRAAINRALRREVFRLRGGESGQKLPWILAEDRLLFFLSLASASASATLSYARRAAGGRETIPSSFIEEARRIFRSPIEERTLQIVPRTGELLAEADLRERVAMDALGLRELRGTLADPLAIELGRRLKTEPWFKAASELSTIEEERLRFFSSEQVPVGRFSGGVSGAAEKELAAAFEFGVDHPISATLLGKFGNCGYQGFLSYGVRLDEVDFPTEEIDARAQGSLWHGVLENLFHRLRDRGLLGRALDEIPAEVLDEAIAGAAEELEATEYVGHPAVWKLGRERARRMAIRVLSTSLPFEGHVPEHLELAFGRPDSPAQWRQVLLPAAAAGEREVYFEGKIDRLDRADESIGVLDYKSRVPKSIYAGLLSTEFQIPLYLYACKSAGHRGDLSAAWFGLKDGRVVNLNKSLALAGVTLESLLTADPKDRAMIDAFGGKNFANAVHRLVGEMRSGRFPARPHDCKYCSYRAVCRISERRIPEVNGD